MRVQFVASKPSVDVELEVPISQLAFGRQALSPENVMPLVRGAVAKAYSEYFHADATHEQKQAIEQTVKHSLDAGIVPEWKKIENDIAFSPAFIVQDSRLKISMNLLDKFRADVDKVRDILVNAGMDGDTATQKCDNLLSFVGDSLTQRDREQTELIRGVPKARSVTGSTTNSYPMKKVVPIIKDQAQRWEELLNAHVRAEFGDVLQETQLGEVSTALIRAGRQWQEVRHQIASDLDVGVQITDARALHSIAEIIEAQHQLQADPHVYVSQAGTSWQQRTRSSHGSVDGAKHHNL